MFGVLQKRARWTADCQSLPERLWQESASVAVRSRLTRICLSNAPDVRSCWSERKTVSSPLPTARAIRDGSPQGRRRLTRAHAEGRADGTHGGAVRALVAAIEMGKLPHVEEPLGWRASRRCDITSHTEGHLAPMLLGTPPSVQPRHLQIFAYLALHLGRAPPSTDARTPSPLNGASSERVDVRHPHRELRRARELPFSGAVLVLKLGPAPRPARTPSACSCAAETTLGHQGDLGHCDTRGSREGTVAYLASDTGKTGLRCGKVGKMVGVLDESLVRFTPNITSTLTHCIAGALALFRFAHTACASVFLTNTADALKPLFIADTRDDLAHSSAPPCAELALEGALAAANHEETPSSPRPHFVALHPALEDAPCEGALAPTALLHAAPSWKLLDATVAPPEAVGRERHRQQALARLPASALTRAYAARVKTPADPALVYSPARRALAGGADQAGAGGRGD
ncbi:hypothetical protein DFH09DRAFT_1375884 [Mycena vulgaris]|nr:hypothetical protein DFH09DRAFT_1375884 [Mycena vulgaris]